MHNQNLVVTTVRLAEDDLDWAKKRAEQLDVPVSWVIRQALKAERLTVELAEGE